MTTFGPVSVERVIVDIADIHGLLIGLKKQLLELEARQVHTEFRPDYAEKLMLEVRLDTNEVIATRPLTLQERNANLFEGEGNENAQSRRNG